MSTETEPISRPATSRRRIVWIASYPRSGNTWTRLLLANAVAGEAVSINRIGEALPGNLASDRHQFDDLTGVESALCTDDEVDALRPEAYRECARQAAEEGVPLLLCKAHDAMHKTSAGEPLFPVDATVGAIYLVRNPLDVAVSTTFQTGHRDFSATIARLNDRDCSVRATARHLRERRSSWSEHVESWLAAPFPVLLVRYEDLLADTPRALARMVRFLDLDCAAERLRQAVRTTGFQHLRQQEEREGFRENKTGAARFFHSGRAGHWRRHLTAAQVRSVADAHHRTMSALGYSVQERRSPC